MGKNMIANMMKTVKNGGLIPMSIMLEHTTVRCRSDNQ